MWYCVKSVLLVDAARLRRTRAIEESEKHR